MIKSDLFPNKEFSTKEELFLELKANKEIILDEKKSQIQKSCDKGISVKAKPILTEKVLGADKSLNMDKDCYYIAVNSTRILDSHKDLHLDGLWNKTVKDQQGKNYLVADHELKMMSTIVRKAYIEMFTAIVPFSLLGKEYDGETEVLFYKFPKDKVTNAVVKEWLESGDEIEASVRMRYVKVELALNSQDKADIEEYACFLKYYPMIANKSDFEQEIYYFFPVMEAENVRESSLVLFGSNAATGQAKENKEAVEDTSENEPTVVTQTQVKRRRN